MATILLDRGSTLYEMSILPGTAPRNLAPSSRQPHAYDLSVRLSHTLIVPFPFMSANMEKVTGKKMLLALALQGGLPILHQFAPVAERAKIISEVLDEPIDRKTFPHANLDKKSRLIIGAAVGYDNAEDSARKLMKAGVSIIVFDSANGYTPGFVENLKKIKDTAEDHTIVIAGNVGTAEGVELLFQAGADGVKVGIGVGTGCDTGPQTGVYVPQIRALSSCAEVATSYKGFIIADGGVKKPRDAVVALCFAHMVMMGSVFAGTDESPGSIMIGPDQKKYIGYAGSASQEQRQERSQRYPDHYFGQRVYEANEGISGFVPYRGTVMQVLTEFTNVLRTTMWYVGVKDLASLRKYATLLPLSKSAQKELEKADIFRFGE